MLDKSKDLAIIGRFEGEETEHDVQALQVAALNGAQVAFALRQVFAADERTLYMTKLGRGPRRIVDLISDPDFTHRVQ